MQWLREYISCLETNQNPYFPTTQSIYHNALNKTYMKYTTYNEYLMVLQCDKK